MSEVPRLLDALRRDHLGEPWHGSSVTAIAARRDGATGGGTRGTARTHLWELVLHMTAWKHEVRRRLLGAPAGEPEEGDWPAVGATTPERWAEALANLHAAHDALVAVVRELPESRLFEPTSDPRTRPLGTGVSHYELLHGLVQHDAYHAGQLALLIKVLRAQSGASSAGATRCCGGAPTRLRRAYP